MAKELEEDRHSEDLGDDLEVGHDPHGDADPGSCGATPNECEIQAHVFDAPPERSQVPIMEEAMEPFVQQPSVLGMDPADGLPVPLDEGRELHEAPPLRYDNFICVEDARTYVEVSHNEIFHIAHPNRGGVGLNRIEQVTHLVTAAGGTLIRLGDYNADGSPTKRRTFKPEEVKHAFGLTYAWLEADSSMPVGPQQATFVQPIRPRCEHLRRQVLNLAGVSEGEKGHFLVFRNCNVRRSVGGALMSLRDEAVYACDYRSPPDPESVKKYLDEPEKKQLEREPVRLPMFHGPAVPLPDLEH